MGFAKFMDLNMAEKIFFSGQMNAGVEGDSIWKHNSLPLPVQNLALVYLDLSPKLCDSLIGS